MKKYHLAEVVDAQLVKAFLEFPVHLYRKDPNWIRPFDIEIENIFDPEKNKNFRNGEAIRWILKDADHNTVGRVAAFFDRKAVSTKKVSAGGLGFFDCINDKDAAFILFDACRDWLKERGMAAMDGPVNFGDRDNFWGCLVDGFYEPVYNMPYNFPYYQELFEAYGFKNFFNQYTYHRKIAHEGLSEAMHDKARRVFNNPDYSFVIYDHKKKDKIAEDFTHIFNAAWGRFPGVPKTTKAHAAALIKQMRPIMDKHLIHIAYYKGDPVGFFIMLPDIGQVIKKFNGKINTINKLRLIYAIRVSKKITRIIGKLFGVVPEHQGKGVEGGLVMAFYQYSRRPGFRYTDLEMNWIGDFNPSMMKVCEQIEARIYKTHVTYRYLFDREATFERASRVNI